eukprot:490009-Pyramimonas_sp.AAC.1
MGRASAIVYGGFSRSVLQAWPSSGPDRSSMLAAQSAAKPWSISRCPSAAGECGFFRSSACS